MLEKYGESISTGDLYAMIGQLTEKGYGGQSLPDHVGPEDFARKYMDFAEAGEDGEELEPGEDFGGEGDEYGEAYATRGEGGEFDGYGSGAENAGESARNADHGARTG